ncbi:uncharacterized protein TRIADDRAFT_25797 [Trichoplax adhaerens]|uniref:E3 UFM1-protein ligase 1 homolog n=1 Tax=Trichoplax adhaerens TaxID=10228 RepID=UFL1_TRIAD|nr:hypothetical protein TRIADDRAFT_25797 [Trichoplax adhaerens]B3RYG4.1 RecName: Full=E3 UFM1-protein ligase 1 homolog; AltName: Full=E3 UFM1-protein transferase 1 homolog [Trichoplax adhaerens]EDV25034.1 hypothetical protein TRIADDRAFT_25797 [Trichoplax adhaerens]|eukprot:XP_002112924.1 hypothetical protein TRIADDRAFT_25797 [Trichoplax adhaerens]
MSDWNEIQRLAADFQRIQLTASAHQLSERNCIEIITKLIAMNKVQVMYTIDGKEYLTPQQLEREIRDELFVHSGRINLVELQQVINVDLTHIDSKVKEMLRGDRSLYLIQGDLIDRDYIDRLAEEINDILQESGQISVSELGKTFNLPTDFLQTNIEKRMGIYIHGQVNPLERGTIYTEAYVARHAAKIRGVFSAITRPTSVSSIIYQYSFPEALLHDILRKLLDEKRLAGSVQGHQSKAIYTPNIYSRTQSNWVLSFFRQNDYIEYDSLTRLDITDPKNYLKKCLNKNVIFLESCVSGQNILGQVQAAIEDVVATPSWVDIMTLLPSPFTTGDASVLLQKHCLKSNKNNTSVQCLCDKFVVSNKFIQNCLQLFDDHMKTKAEKVYFHLLFIDAGKVAAKFASTSSTNPNHSTLTKHDDSNVTGGKKKKGDDSTSSKRKGKGKDRSTPDDLESTRSHIKQNKQDLEFMAIPEIIEVLQREHSNCEDQFLEEIASQLFSPLKRKYQEVAKSVFLASTSSVTSEKRKLHSDAQDKINGLLTNAKLFGKGLQHFSGDAHTTLGKHLLHTLCTEITNIVFSLLISEHIMVDSDPNSLNPETRSSALEKFPNNVKKAASALEKSLSGKDVEQFFDALDVVLGPSICQIMIKKLDKKKERQIIFNHRQSLIEQLNKESKPAMCLHLCTLLLFQRHTQCMIHAPGRCIPQIISFLKQHLTDEQYKTIYEYQQLIIQSIQQSSDKQKPEMSEEPKDSDNSNDNQNIDLQLQEKMTTIKAIALENKKQS